jgi:hypothetical protein
MKAFLLTKEHIGGDIVVTKDTQFIFAPAFVEVLDKPASLTFIFKTPAISAELLGFFSLNDLISRLNIKVVHEANDSSFHQNFYVLVNQAVNFFLEDYIAVLPEANNVESALKVKGLFSVGDNTDFSLGTKANLPEEKKIPRNAAREAAFLDDSKFEVHPFLDINNDTSNVVHSVSMGNLQQTSLFYIKSRGFSEEEAKDLLINGFKQDFLNKIKNLDLVKKFEEGGLNV